MNLSTPVLASATKSESLSKKFFGKTSQSCHLVGPSPWPLVTSFAALFLVTSLTCYMHFYAYSLTFLLVALVNLVACMGFWWRDVVRESTFEGNHTTKVQIGIRTGMILFIISEVMFFVAFFWAFFHASLSPSPFIGAVWPPIGIEVLNAFDVPFLNTVILISSGVALTACHHYFLAGNRDYAIFFLLVTIAEAVFFTLYQYLEYVEAAYTIADSAYGSVFFMATGFHGFHVFIGTCFLAVCLARLINNHFTKEHHLGLEAAIWYWHFVDVVWIFLFVVIYWWGNN